MIFLTVKPLRTAVCFAFILTLFIICIARITAIIKSDKITAAVQNNTTVITLSQLRGNIFDCNGVPLTGLIKKNYAVITPTPTPVTYCSAVLYGDQKEQVMEKLS